jgi:Sel1 repeat
MEWSRSVTSHKRLISCLGALSGFLLAFTASAPVKAADVPFRFEANSRVYEGVAKFENGHLRGDASNGLGSVHLDGEVRDYELTVQATGNFLPGVGMGSNLMATGSIRPAVGKVSFVMPGSADKDYGVSLRCKIYLDLSALDVATSPALQTTVPAQQATAPAAIAPTLPAAAPTVLPPPSPSPVGAAEVNLGNIYLAGTGVPQDYAQAMQLFRKAADRGYAEAQYNVGLMYFRGQGMPEDDVQAYIWFNLAAAGGFAKAADARAQTEQLMTTKQVSEAQKLSREWKPTGL